MRRTVPIEVSKFHEDRWKYCTYALMRRTVPIEVSNFLGNQT